MTTTADGSPIDLYLGFPPAGEAERIHETIPPGAEVLDLGCGVGRIAHELIRLGHPVVAVDESPEMLRHIRGAETVAARIEGLDLGRTFPLRPAREPSRQLRRYAPKACIPRGVRAPRRRRRRCPHRAP